MSEVNLGNARDPEQARRMEELKKNGLCYFCRQGSAENGTLPTVLREWNHWYIMSNNFPQATHHYMIVSKEHVDRVTSIRSFVIQLEFFEILQWLEVEFNSPGFSFYGRNGDMDYTGATLDHFHCHFLSGERKPADWKGLEDNVLITLGYKKRG